MVAKSKKDKQFSPVSAQDAEDELVGLAMKLARQQLMEGTASPSVITHFLKIGSTSESIERRLTERQITLLEAKADNLANGKGELASYQEVIEALKGYSSSDDFN